MNRNQIRRWKFATKNFLITWDTEPDNDCDMSFDESGETLEKVQRGEWDCFLSIVTCYHKRTGAELAVEYLGGSIYADIDDFRKEHIGAQGKYGSYFKDMVHTVCREARKALRQMQTIELRKDV